MRYFLVIFLAVLSFNSKAQSNALWRDHLPYKEVTKVVKLGDLIYASTPYALFSYSTIDNSIERLSKTNVLSEIDVSSIGVNIETNSLVIGYVNGNVDLIRNEETINFPAIINSSLVGDKKIYDVFSESGNAYISTGFGIVKVDLLKDEVNETYIIGDNGDQLKVNGVTIFENKIYAATDEGLRYADVSNSSLSDFSQWKIETSIPNSIASFSSIKVIGNKLLVFYDTEPFSGDEIYQFDGTSWSVITEVSGIDVKSIEVSEDNLIVSTNDKIIEFDSGLNKTNEFDRQGVVYASKIGEDLWFGAGFYEGLIKRASNGNTETFSPKSPLYVDAFKLSKIYNNHLWIATGGVVANQGFPNYNFHGIQHFDGTKWELFNSATNTVMDVPLTSDYLYVSANPTKPNHAIMTNYRAGGIFEWKDGEMTRFYEANSTLQVSDDGENYFIEDVQFDNDENVWIVNSRTNKPLVVKTKEGEWKSFDCGPNMKEVRFSELIVDTRGYKWMVSPNSNGLIVYNDNNTPLDDTDDEFKQFTSSPGSGGLPNAQIWCLAEDLDGQVWLGTEEGIAVVFNPSAIFSDGNYDAQEILIEQDGNVEILLGAERITAIAVDGANRKWVGTSSSGVYCFSPDGLEQVFHFTAENSPLFSNTINDIQINPQIGEVLIATEKGLVGYKSDATSSADNYSDIYAYPNPVRPDYSGNIFINGLVRDSDVKITDIEGNLVFETTSLGGQAVWDGNDKFGNRVSSGIYLAFAASPNGSMAEVTKIMFVK